jgi:predicted extracellular nuclease
LASYNNKACDIVTSGGFADSNGDDQLAIVVGPINSPSYGQMIDIFGVPGEDGTNTAHDFEDGRAERKATSQTPKGTWDANDWVVVKGVAGTGTQKEVADMNPRIWAGTSDTTPAPGITMSTPAPATSSPTSAPTALTIQEIQGTGTVSPYVNVNATINNAYVTAIVSSGFYVQEVPVVSAGDASSGIFVFTTSRPTFVNVGDQVSVLGTVKEYFEWTEIANIATTVVGTTKKFFDPVELSLPATDLAVLEKYESMIVSVVPASGDSLVVSEYFNLDRYGECCWRQEESWYDTTMLGSQNECVMTDYACLAPCAYGSASCCFTTVNRKRRTSKECMNA